MFVRRLLAAFAFAASTALALTGCTASGPGSSTQCELSGCTVTFDRGVDATASVLGIEAKLVAVNGNLVTLSVAGQEVTVPVGEAQSSEGRVITVQKVTEEQVVVEISTGINTGG